VSPHETNASRKQPTIKHWNDRDTSLVFPDNFTLPFSMTTPEFWLRDSRVEFAKRLVGFARSFWIGFGELHSK